jgi:S1-C subfamily serine protease
MSELHALPPLQAFSDAISSLVAQAAPGVVAVESHKSRCSGFVWRPGLIVTADEALAEAGDISVTLSDGTSVRAELAGRDHTTDIALLRVTHPDLKPVGFSPDAIAAGALAVVVGAQGEHPLAAFGMVSASSGAWRSMRGGEINARIELGLRLARAAEGGLALDASGRAIGMAVRGPRKTLVIPAATIDRVAARLERDGHIARGYLGLGLQPVRVRDRGIGAMVMGVEPSGPGAAADVKQGDVIVGWNGESIHGMRTLMRRLGPESVGSVAELSILRGGAPATVSLTIGERPLA